MNFPTNCIVSFIYSKVKNGYNLPSVGIKPKVNGQSGTIKDLTLCNDPSIKHTLIKMKKTPNEILVEISIENAMCLPLPHSEN